MPSLSLSSQNDLGSIVNGVRVPGPVHPAATSTQQRVTLEREDHVAVAGSKNAFVAMWRYLYGEDPEYTTIQCGQDPPNWDSGLSSDRPSDRSFAALYLPH